MSFTSWHFSSETTIQWQILMDIFLLVITKCYSYQAIKVNPKVWRGIFMSIFIFAYNFPPPGLQPGKVGSSPVGNYSLIVQQSHSHTVTQSGCQSMCWDRCVIRAAVCLNICLHQHNHQQTQSMGLVSPVNVIFRNISSLKAWCEAWCLMRYLQNCTDWKLISRGQRLTLSHLCSLFCFTAEMREDGEYL